MLSRQAAHLVVEQSHYPSSFSWVKITLQFDKQIQSSPERSAELVIIHLGLALAGAPQSGHLFRVFDDEFAVIPLPGDDIVVLLLPQQLQDEVPELDLSGARTRLRLVRPVWEGKPQRSDTKHLSLATLMQSSQCLVGVCEGMFYHILSRLIRGCITSDVY